MNRVLFQFMFTMPLTVFVLRRMVRRMVYRRDQRSKKKLAVPRSDLE